MHVQYFFPSALVVLVAAAGCSPSPDSKPVPRSDEPAVRRAVPDTSDGLKCLMADLYAATRDGEKKKAADLVQSLVLPKHEAWFKEVFGDSKGAKAAAEYTRLLPAFEREVEGLFAKIVRAGQSEISVLQFEKSPDPKAVGLQNTAMAAMTKPVRLYSVRFVKPGHRLGQHVYSFVYVEGGFRLVGKMRGVQD